VAWKWRESGHVNGEGKGGGEGGKRTWECKGGWGWRGQSVAGQKGRTWERHSAIWPRAAREGGKRGRRVGKGARMAREGKGVSRGEGKERSGTCFDRRVRHSAICRRADAFLGSDSRALSRSSSA
jgi:hypothetical protein